MRQLIINSVYISNILFCRFRLGYTDRFWFRLWFICSHILYDRLAGIWQSCDDDHGGFLHLFCSSYSERLKHCLPVKSPFHRYQWGAATKTSIKYRNAVHRIIENNCQMDISQREKPANVIAVAPYPALMPFLLSCCPRYFVCVCHGDIITWQRLPYYWPFARGIHRWPIYPPHKMPVMLSVDDFFVVSLKTLLNE